SRPRNHGRSDRRAAIDRVRPGGEPSPRPESHPRAVPHRRLRALRQPVNRPPPLRAKMRGVRRWLRILAGIAILVAIVVAIVIPQAAWNAAQLPLLALFSTTRMGLAYLLSLVFPITYSATAATNHKAPGTRLPGL